MLKSGKRVGLSVRSWSLSTANRDKMSHAWGMTVRNQRENMGISAGRVALHGINKCQRGTMICITTVSRAHSEKAQSPPHATTPQKKNIKKKNI